MQDFLDTQPAGTARGSRGGRRSVSFGPDTTALRRGFRVTERDLAMVRWVGRARFAEAGQVAHRFEMDERNAYRRLRGLLGLRLLDHRRIFHAQPGAYAATRDGLVAVGLALPTARIDVRTYVHDRQVAGLAIEVEREFGPELLITERELRSVDSTAECPRYAVVRGRQATRRGLHFPDLAVELGDGRPLAIELELTAKGHNRLASIVAAYVRGRHIAAVRYYAGPAALRGVQRAVSNAGASRLIDIRPWEVR